MGDPARIGCKKLQLDRGCQFQGAGARHRESEIERRNERQR